MSTPPLLEVMDLTKVSSTFPKIPQPLILRENIVQAVREMLATEAEVVLLDGPEGIGKTTLLAAFALANRHTAFTLFVSGSSRYCYDSTMLATDLCEQLGWALQKENFKHESQEDASLLLQSRIFDLQKQANFEKKTYYFLIDGLHEVPSEGVHEIEMILKLLPFGVNRFRFIISGNTKFFESRLPRLRRALPFRMIGFSVEDTEKYFSDILPDGTINLVHKMCRMTPGRMASLRRLINSGLDLEGALDDFSRNPPDWLEMEWRAVSDSSLATQQALATLAFYRNKLTIESLGFFCDCDPDELRKTLTAFTFLEVEADDTIDFVCEAFRRIASDRLARLRKDTLETIVEHLMSAPSSTQSVEHLPEILHQIGRHDDLVNYLSTQTVDHIISTCESWVPLHQKLEMALEASSKVERDGEMLRFSVQKAALCCLETADSWRQEINAYLALEDYSAIYALVEKAPTKEDRLHLLATIAKSRRKNNLPADTEINEQIQGLYGIIDNSHLGKRRVEIASDLLYSHPELAIDLIQQDPSSSKSESRDIAFARMSISALLDRSGGMESTQKDLRDKIKDPAIQKYVNTAAMHFGSYSADAVIAEVQNWDKIEDRILALKGWATQNRKTSNAELVIEYSLNIILKTTSYTANAGIYRQLCTPLPHLPNEGFVRTIIARLDGLKIPLEQAGPTTEYIRLQTILAEAEYKFNRQSSLYRFQDTLFYADKISDSSTRMESFAILVSRLKEVDPEDNFSTDEPLLDLAIDGLHSAADQILGKAADHLEAIRPAVSILSTAQPTLAFDIISKLNTNQRQYRALGQMARTISEEPITASSLEVIYEAISRIKCDLVRGAAVRTALENIHKNRSKVILKDSRILSFNKLIDDIESAYSRCRLRATLLSIIDKSDVTLKEDFRRVLIEKISSDFSLITTGWLRTKCGFKLADLLAKVEPLLAKEILSNTESDRREIVFDTDDSANCYISCVRLCIRALGGLAKGSHHTPNDIEAIANLISRLPCKTTQVAAWADLANRLFASGARSDGLKIVDFTIKPALSKHFTGDVEAYNLAVSASAVALHCAHAPSALQIISKLPPLYADQGFCDIIQFVVAGQLPFDLQDPAYRAKDCLKYEAFLDISEVMTRLNSDANLYWALDLVVESIGSKRFRNTYNKNQIADVTARLKAIGNDRLPRPGYIKHDGYKILHDAMVYQLTGDNTKWGDLLLAARGIPNSADVAFVWAGLAERMPRREKSEKIEVGNILRETKSRIAGIPFFEDRLNHYENLAKISLEIDKDFCKECLKEAWHEAVPLDSTDLPQARKRLIDFAHRLDPDFASHLASEMNDDAGRRFAREEAKQQIALLKMKEDVASGKPKEFDVDDLESCVELAKLMLKGLNSGRPNTLHLNKIRPYIQHAGNIGLNDSFWIYSWVIENAVRRFGDQNNAVAIIRPLYESSRVAAELTLKIAARKRAIADSGILAARSSDAGRGLVRKGEREIAVGMISEWAKSATDYIKITDPYFGVDDLDIVGKIREQNPEIPIFILTSRRHQKELASATSWEDAYQSHWRISISELDPGSVCLTLIGCDSNGDHPIHDRWVLSSSSGLRLGTSINSVGSTKSSEISPIAGPELTDLIAEFDGWWRGAPSHSLQTKVRRTMFEL